MSNDSTMTTNGNGGPVGCPSNTVADELAVRARASRRRWLCPGGGLAFVGSSMLATIVFLLTPVLAVVTIWVCLQPSALSFWIFMPVFVAAGISQFVEGAVIKKVRIRAPRPRILVDGFVVLGCLVWLSGIIVVWLLLTSFGSLKMAASGMSPTLRDGDRLLYHKRIDWRSVRPGVVVAYRNADDSAWGEPGLLLISRILAGPGDTLSITDGKYLVNGKTGPIAAPTWTHRVVIDVPRSPAAIAVPPDCYFVVQDSPTSSLDSRVLSWLRKEKLISAKLWYQKRGSILKPVE